MLLRESPLSQKLALRELREGAGKSLATCLRTEYRAVAHLVDDHSDFDEGIRALLIDKDGKPKWQHASLKEVSETRLCFCALIGTVLFKLQGLTSLLNALILPYCKEKTRGPFLYYLTKLARMHSTLGKRVACDSPAGQSRLQAYLHL